MNWMRNAMSGTNPCACMVRFHELRSSVGWNVMQRRLDRAGKYARDYAAGWF